MNSITKIQRFGFLNPNPNPNIRMEDCDGVLHWINLFLEDDPGCDVAPPMSLSDLWDCRAIGVVAANVLVSFIWYSVCG